MPDVLLRIKRAVLAGRYEFSEKARWEMDADGITELDVIESIATAMAIQKKLRSMSSARQSSREYLFVIISPNLQGTLIYSKGKLIKSDDGDKVYVFVSSKLAVRESE